MKAMHLEPKNALETAMEQAQLGNASMSSLMRMLVSTDLFIVSVEEVAQGSQGLHPLLFDRGGTPMAAVYTEISRTELVNSKIKAVVRMKGKDIFRNTPPGYGIVINPGFDIGLELLPEGVQNVVNTYCMN